MGNLLVLPFASVSVQIFLHLFSHLPSSPTYLHTCSVCSPIVSLFPRLDAKQIASLEEDKKGLEVQVSELRNKVHALR